MLQFTSGFIKPGHKETTFLAQFRLRTRFWIRNKLLSNQ